MISAQKYQARAGSCLKSPCTAEQCLKIQHPQSRWEIKKRPASADRLNNFSSRFLKSTERETNGQGLDIRSQSFAEQWSDGISAIDTEMAKADPAHD